MTRPEAEEACVKLAAEHPDRKTHHWRPREESDGTWSVVKIALPPTDFGTPEVRADEKPPTPDDPRSSAMRDLGPNVGPGI